MDGSDTNSATTETFSDNPLSSVGNERRTRVVQFSRKNVNEPRIATAVIVINVQNEFVDWTSKLHRYVGDMMEKTGMLDKVPHVIRAAR